MAILVGTQGDDRSGTLTGTAANDSYFGLGGSDFLFPSLGSDTLDGGDGFDVAIYDASPLSNGITINNTSTAIGALLAFSVDKGAGQIDLLIDVENFHGTRFNDVIYVGGLGDTYTIDRSGDDYVEASQDPNADEGHYFVAGSGNDTYVGTLADDDTVEYLGDDGADGAGPIVQGVIVDLDAQTATDGWGDTDTLIGIERIVGTRFDDVILGSDARNRFEGGEGDDYFDGRSDDDNRVDYRDDPSGINVDLALGTATDGWGNTDTLVRIQQIRGSDFDDTIRGDAENNGFTGKNGNDTLRGFDGNDHFEGGAGNDTLDGGDGTDYVDYRGEDGSGAVSVNLLTGLATDTFGDTDTLIDIEEVEGTDQGDTLIGDNSDNYLTGEGGNDTISGLGGNDDLRGGAGNDTLSGGDDNDNLHGGAGDDILDGGDGDGDEVRYHRDEDDGATMGVDVDLAAGTATDGFGDTDTLIDIEDARGTDFDDVLRGRDDARSHLRGEGGDDTLIGRSTAGARGDNLNGGAGDDTIIGGASDEDYAEYGFEDDTFTGIDADLESGVVLDGLGGTDTVSGIESIGGTRFGDTITGDGADNYIEGRESDDTLSGGDGNDQLVGGRGNDTLNGGSHEADYNGGDRVRYDDDHENGGTQGIDASLITGIAIDTFGDTDTLIDIEEIEGSIFDDTITGADGNDRLRGNDGDDVIIGNGGHDNLSDGAGDDTLFGGDGGDYLQLGLGTDVVYGGAGGASFESDELSYIYGSVDDQASAGIAVTFTNETDGSVVDYGGDTDTFESIDVIAGTNNADSFIGAQGEQEFRGFGGDDFFDGGDGDSDQINYRNDDDRLGAFQGVVVDMVAGTAIDAFGDTDTFINIEEIQGSERNDTITGNSERNGLYGEDGDDVIDSFGGEDNNLQGGRGHDTLFARGDSDYVDGGDGNDTITFFGEGGGVNPGLGSDTILGGTSGFFSIGYEGVGESVTIDTALGTTILAGGDVDTFTNIRNIGGGDGDDTLLGDDGAERQEFFSSRGNDTIDGRGGGRDHLIYDEGDETSVVVDFSTGTATGTFAGTDTFSNIEAVRGTHGDDTFIGSGQAFTEYQGLDGVDTYTGGSGIDRLSFTFDDNRGGNGAITVDLGAGTAIDGFGNAETFTSIEQVISSDGDDTLTGDGNDNLLIGLRGNDTILGGGGDDGIYAGEGIDTVTGGAGADTFGGRIYELDGDTITDFSSEDQIALLNEDFDAISADLTIVGNELRIDVDGDGDADATLILANGYTGPVTSAGGPLPVPTEGDDDLTGTDGDDTVDLLAGEDRYLALAGNDIVHGGAGADTLIGGAGNDQINGDSGDDILIGGDLPDLSDSAGGQVYRLYQATLDRVPDTGGFENWVNALDTNAFTLQSVVNGFVGSQEFNNTYGNLGNTGFVTLLYNNVLDRAPDPGGLDGWVGALENGMSRARVVTGFSESDEFKNNTDTEASIYASALEGREQSGVMDDVFRLYQATLDRAPDPAGLTNWSTQLADGQAYTTIAAGFTNSAEFRNTYGNLDDRAFVEQLYRNVLDREADAGGLQNWLNVIIGGGTREDVVRGFAQSAEFIRNTDAAFDAYMKAGGGDTLDGGAGNNTLYSGVTADTFIFDAAEDGTDKVLQLDTWDTLQFEGFGYVSAADARAQMAAVGADVRFADQGVNITFAGADLTTMQEVDYLFG